MDFNQIKIFINLEIIGEKDKNKKIYIYFLKKNIKKFCNLVKSLSITTISKPNFYYIVYDLLRQFRIA